MPVFVEPFETVAASPATGVRSVTMLGRMPYLDEAVAALESRSDAAELAAWAPNAHWGLFDNPDEHADTTSLVAATTRMNDLICECAAIAPGAAVLDVGCGFGGTVQNLDRRLSDSRLVGVNIDERQLRICAPHPASAGNFLGWVCADGCHLPLRAGAFDAVLSVESAFHMDSRSAFFREVSHVLRASGRFVVADFVLALGDASPKGSAQRGAELGTLLDARSALNDFFGHSPAGLVSLRSYERHARAHELRLDQDLDISERVMPSFASVSAIYDRSSDSSRSRAAIRELQALMNDGVVEYHILTFIRS
jgi:SAM-dependent methyltransferase